MQAKWALGPSSIGSKDYGSINQCFKNRSDRQSATKPVWFNEKTAFDRTDGRTGEPAVKPVNRRSKR